jgi:predicted house-cleaning noncanonical NTP pyrophosphatase (MazG superfamily)
MTVHRKLVRDRIPAIIRSDGRRPVVQVLAPGQRRAALFAKLLEEADEAVRADAHDVLEELADVLEVLRALAAELGLSMADVTAVADHKRAERGGFDGGLFLVEVV